MLPLLLLAPMICAIIIIGWQKNPERARYIALGGSVISLLLLPFVGYGQYIIPWFKVGGAVFSIETLVLPVNMILLGILLILTPAIIFYSFGYIDKPSEQRRFYIEMLAFEAAMTAFAVSGNFVLMFIAWEFLSLTSYLLIGFRYGREKAVKASRKALSIVFIGDVALLASIIIFFNIFGTLEFSSVISLAQLHFSAYFFLGIALLTIAVLTKSAQFPFHEWLIDAMEGPTPVSAYLHSSTMVKAGVFTLLILFPLFKEAGILNVIMAFAAVTAAIATLNALRERHVKKIMAYSTIQELSLMVIAICSNALLAAIYFFFAQSFYKALLFFSSGSAMEATGKENIDDISGAGSNKLVYISTLFGVLALAGFVPFDGFFANVALGSSLTNFYMYIFISGIGLLTSFYIFRWFFSIGKNAKSREVALNYESLPMSMVYSMVALSFSTLIASFFFGYMPAFLLSSEYYNYVAGSIAASIPYPESMSFLAIIAIGAVLSYIVYGRKEKLGFSAGRIDKFVRTGWLFSLAYEFAAGVMYELAEGASLFDSYVSDVFDSVGSLVVVSGSLFRRVSVGQINRYILIVMTGMLLLLGYIYLVAR